MEWSPGQVPSIPALTMHGQTCAPRSEVSGWGGCPGVRVAAALPALLAPPPATWGQGQQGPCAVLSLVKEASTYGLHGAGTSGRG